MPALDRSSKSGQVSGVRGGERSTWLPWSAFFLAIGVFWVETAHAGNENRSSQVEAMAPLDNLWGLFGESNEGPRSRVRRLAEIGGEKNRAALLAALEPALGSRSSRPRLELARALHVLGQRGQDQELTLALIALFRAETSADDPLGALAVEAAAMALGRTQGPLGPRVLSLTADDPDATSPAREAAKRALAALAQPSEKPSEELLQERSAAATTRATLDRAPNLALLEASLHAVEFAFAQGAEWTAVRLAEQSPLAARNSGDGGPGPRVARFAAWLEDDSLVLRLTTAAGLGRRLGAIGRNSDRDTIVMALEERYEVETLPSVRRAIIIALARARAQGETSQATLKLAADLDVDPWVRNLAQESLEQPALFEPAPQFRPNPPSDRATSKPLQVLEFALDGTPCFTPEQCRVLPFRAAGSGSKRKP
jgi:hypothetical protein